MNRKQQLIRMRLEWIRTRPRFIRWRQDPQYPLASVDLALDHADSHIRGILDRYLGSGEVSAEVVASEMRDLETLAVALDGVACEQADREERLRYVHQTTDLLKVLQGLLKDPD